GYLRPSCGVCADLGDGLESLEPFGQGTPSPLWHLRGELDAQRLVGKTSGTLQFSLGGVRGVKFREPTTLEGTLDVAAQVQRSEFRGQVRLELMAEGLRPAGTLGLSGSSSQADFPRLNPREAMAHLRAGAWAYAEGAVAEYLQGNIPGVRLLEPGQELAGEVVLYALPPEADLRGWLAQAASGKGRVSFAWGPKTLGELDESYSGRERGAEKAADAYRRWQWGQFYRVLDDEGWAGAAAALLGLEAGLELAGVAD
ncbi:MAG: single-stranded-DNA-specific exonuclease RecJ, partial [Deinococcus sp.]